MTDEARLGSGVLLIKDETFLSLFNPFSSKLLASGGGGGSKKFPDIPFFINFRIHVLYLFFNFSV